MSGAWSASVEILGECWVDVPKELGSDQQRWVGEQLARVREHWSTSWQAAWESDIEQVLTVEANSRDDDSLLSLLCWPVPGPVVGKVEVRIGPMTPVAAWEEAGFEVDSYHGAALGPGVQCIGLNFVDVDGERVEAGVAHYLFGDGAHMVQVVAGPTFAQALHLMMPGLHRLLDSLQVHRPDGRSFAAVPNPAVPFVVNEEWELGQDVQRQP